MLRARIVSISSALPAKVRTSKELEGIIRKNSSGIFLPTGIIELLTGVRERRLLPNSKNASDLAAQAALKAIRFAKIAKSEIDCLIFAAAGADILDPATAN